MEKEDIFGGFIFRLGVSLFAMVITFISNIGSSNAFIVTGLALLFIFIGISRLAKIDNKNQWKDVAFGGYYFFTALLTSLIPAWIFRIILLPNDTMTVKILSILIGVLIVLVLALMSYTYEQRTKREKKEAMAVAETEEQ